VRPGRQHGPGCPFARAPATLCTVPMVSGAGYSFSTVHMCLQRAKAEQSRSPMGTESTVARASDVLDVAESGTFKVLERELYESQKIQQSGLQLQFARKTYKTGESQYRLRLSQRCQLSIVISSVTRDRWLALSHALQTCTIPGRGILLRCNGQYRRPKATVAFQEGRQWRGGHSSKGKVRAVDKNSGT
jgi:hypothetical protein